MGWTHSGMLIYLFIFFFRLGRDSGMLVYTVYLIERNKFQAANKKGSLRTFAPGPPPETLVHGIVEICIVFDVLFFCGLATPNHRWKKKKVPLFFVNFFCIKEITQMYPRSQCINLASAWYSIKSYRRQNYVFAIFYNYKILQYFSVHVLIAPLDRFIAMILVKFR